MEIWHEARVLPEWIDSNGHMNLAYYVVVFDHATDVLFDRIGLGTDYRRASGNTMFVAETHTLYEREMAEGEALRVRPVVLDADAKRLHFGHEMFHAASGKRAAVQELMALHIDLSVRRTSPFPADRLDAIAAARSLAPRPDWAGRKIAMPAAK
jgi:acyl-CoA thioester hydrolase